MFTTGKGGPRATFFLALVVALHLDEVLARGDEKPKHGGIMGRGDETVTVEFVFKDGVLAIYVFGPGRPAERASHPAERHRGLVGRDFPRDPALESPA